MIDRGHMVMTEERLDALANRFIGRQVRELLHIAFVEYVEDPDYFDGLVEALEGGRGLVGQARPNGVRWTVAG